MPVRLSIVIPTLNEADGIAQALAALQPLRAAGAQVIGADGGSSDATAALAAALCDHVLQSERGRARQMNNGARWVLRQARGAAADQVLLFLHADTRLPETACADIQQALAQGASWGRFDVTLSGNHWLLRIVENMMNWRSRWSGIATGDQGIFVRGDLFQRLGGFADIALMEDIDFSRRAKRVARPACLRQRVLTSSRRWERHGIVRTIFLMSRLRLAYFLGASPDELARRYAKG